MNSQDIKMVCAGVGVSLADLARRLGLSPQNFNNKMKRDSFSSKELMEIAKALGVEYVSYMTLPDGQRIGTTPEVFNKWKEEQAATLKDKE